MKLFTQRLRPFGAMDADHLAKALIDLDNDRFQVREKASNELARLGELAEPFLRQTLDRQPSLEVRRRVQLLLSKLETATLAPDQLRTMRAVRSVGTHRRRGGARYSRLTPASSRRARWAEKPRPAWTGSWAESVDLFYSDFSTIDDWAGFSEDNACLRHADLVQCATAR